MSTFLATVLHLAYGILVIQDDSVPVAPEQAIQYATAAAYHAGRSGLDAYELVGIARNESDFKPDSVSRDGKDCGITQTRTTYSRYRCRELNADVWLSFSEASRELVENRERCERTARGDLTRCRLNSYNSGVSYARSGWTGNYWLRVMCFAEAARRGETPSGDCRRVRDRGDIAYLFRAPRVSRR
jgi:hypothetical protein